MNIIPHDRSDFFQTQQYKKSVFQFFQTELDNDGLDITALFIEKNNIKSKKENVKKNAYIIAKDSGMIAGEKEITDFFSKEYKNVEISFLKKDGEFFENGDKIIILSGNSADILKIERIILNTLSRMSGIATTTTFLQKKSETALAATRKTQWSFLDKKAVHVGGGLTHRMGLFDAILIKENHRIINDYDLEIFSDEYFEEKIKNIQKINKIGFIEIEVETHKEFEILFEIFWKRKNIKIPVVIMFDNFTPEQIKIVLETIPFAEDRHAKNIFLEISGGITEKNITEYSSLGADVISMGVLTHSVMPLDFSLRFEE